MSSENSIDVDVNFHLNDINTLFEKFMEGLGNEEILGDIGDIEGKMAGTLSHDISSIEDKNKLYENLIKMNLQQPEIDQLIKMMSEMGEDQGEGFESLDRVKNNMILMLSIAKSMMRMLEDKFPITADIEKELEDVTKILSQQETSLDDKLQLVMRAINNMMTPTTTQEAFKIITPDIDFGRFTTPAEKKNREDEFNVNALTIETLIKQIEDAQSGRIRTTQLQSLLENARDSIGRMSDLFDDTQDRLFSAIVEARSDRGGEPEGVETPEGKVSRTIRTDVSVRMNQIEELGKFVGILRETLEETAVEFKKDIDIALRDIEVATDAITKMVIDLDPLKIGISTKDKEQFRDTIKDGLKRIEDKLDSELFEQTVDEVWKSAVRTGAIKDPAERIALNKLNKLIDLNEAIFNTIEEDLYNLIATTAGERQEEKLAQLGITNITAVRSILNVGRERKGDILKEFDISDELTTGIADIKIMSGMIEIIGSQATSQVQSIQEILENTSDSTATIKKVLSATEAIKRRQDEASEKISNVTSLTSKANSGLEEILGKTKGNTDSLDKLVSAWNSNLGSILGDL